MNFFDEDLVNCAASIPDKFYNSSFFITGSTGLIGSLIIKSILKANESYNSNILIYAQARNEEKVKEVFAEYLNNKYLNFLYGDIQKSLSLNNQVDFIIHAASQTASKEMVEHPVNTSKVSLIGTINVLDFAITKQIKGFIYLSSMEAFGECNNSKTRLSEKDLGYIDLTNIRNCYSESKRMCELLCKCYYKEYGLNVYIARLAQVFGAGISKSENRVFAQFTRNALHEENIVLHTDGTSWGNYCYTTDVFKAFFKMLESGIPGETYTVVNEDASMMIKDMAQLIINILDNKKSKIVFDIPEDTNKYGYAPKTVMKLSNSKLKKLGWKPEVPLKEMFTRLIQYMKDINA